MTGRGGLCRRRRGGRGGREGLGFLGGRQLWLGRIGRGQRGVALLEGLELPILLFFELVEFAKATEVFVTFFAVLLEQEDCR